MKRSRRTQNSDFKTSKSKYYNDDSKNGPTYGRLYSWKDAVDSVCPLGWHLPTDDNWKTLEQEIGMSLIDANNKGDRGTDEGKKLKSKNNWKYSSKGGNSSDIFGFNGQPAGVWEKLLGIIYFHFHSIGDETDFWTSSSTSNSKAYIRSLSYKNDQIYRGKKLKTGMYSVRCVKDK